MHWVEEYDVKSDFVGIVEDYNGWSWSEEEYGFYFNCVDGSKVRVGKVESRGEVKFVREYEPKSYSNTVGFERDWREKYGEDELDDLIEDVKYYVEGHDSKNLWRR